MAKIYVLDTNVLLHDPESLFSLADNRIVLPLSVIEELDQIKRRMDDIGRNAREASRKLDGLRMLGHLSEGVKLPAGGSIRIELNGYKSYDLLSGIDLTRIMHEKFLKEERTSAKMLLSPNNQLQSKDVLWKQSAITSSVLKAFFTRKSSPILRVAG
jgi:predicted ribonuclease YlaK